MIREQTSRKHRPRAWCGPINCSKQQLENRERKKEKERLFIVFYSWEFSQVCVYDVSDTRAAFGSFSFTLDKHLKDSCTGRAAPRLIVSVLKPIDFRMWLLRLQPVCAHVHECGFAHPPPRGVRSHHCEVERRPHDPHQRSEVKHLAVALLLPFPPPSTQTALSDSTAAANKGSRRLIRLNSWRSVPGRRRQVKEPGCHSARSAAALHLLLKTTRFVLKLKKKGRSAKKKWTQGINSVYLCCGGEQWLPLFPTL